ncbi:hypothetical protein [Streptomyces celluloflavus]|uniref:hypothetical protein n=1 Tax=Streptomyces celluloflavus TaxID=58344 RepID=UPI003460A496|nr:hypothetical protein OG717_10640 [Streptomyces celluloflavus]
MRRDLELSREPDPLAQAALADAYGPLRPPQLPPDAGKFLVGRRQIVDGLNSLLMAARQAGAALTVAVNAPPGAGKDTLAVPPAHKISTSVAPRQ